MKDYPLLHLLKMGLKNFWSLLLLNLLMFAPLAQAQNTLPDSTRTRLLNELQWIEENATTNPQKAADISARGYKQSSDYQWREGKGRFSLARALSYYHSGNIYQSIQWNIQGEATFDPDLHTIYIIKAKRQLGRSYERLGNFRDALQHWMDALDLSREVGDIESEGRLLSSIATIHTKMHDPEKAIEYEKQSIEKKRFTADSLGIAISLNNIGSNYMDLEQYRQALKEVHKSLVLHKRLNDASGKVYNYATLSEIHQKIGQLDSALNYAQASLEVSYQLDDPYEIAYGHNDLGRVLIGMRQFTRALQHLRTAQKLALVYNSNDVLELVQLNLSKAFSGLKVWDSAYHYQQQYLLNREDFWQQEASKVEQMNDYYYNEKRENVIKLLQQEQELARAGLRQQELLNYISAGLITGILFIFTYFYRNVEERNMLYEVVSEKTTSLEDSLLYARKIQTALLPDERQLNSLLHEYFVLYQPRDIVSGDFYWAAGVAGKVVVVAADCTGHGVPGALMSMIGIEKLSEIVQVNMQTSPGKILTELDEGIKHALSQKETQNTDGMDIGICTIEEAKEGLLITYAGAQNNLVVVADNNGVPASKVYKGTRLSIGGTYTPEAKRFEEHTIFKKAEETLCFYMFSDGYQDQFGGPKQRKFMRKNMVEIMEVNYKQPMAQQGRVFEDALRRWKGQEEQVDDILLLGYRL